MKKSYILAAVLCTVPVMTIMGCRSGGAHENDPAYDDDLVMKPLNADENDPQPASPANEPEQVPAEDEVDNTNPEIVRLRAELAELRREAGLAPVDSSTPSAEPEQASAPADSRTQPSYDPSHGTLPVPEYAAYTVLLEGMEILSPLLRCEKLWGSSQIPQENYFGACFFNGKRPRLFIYNVPNGTTHRGGKIDVDDLEFIDPDPVRPRKFDVEVEEGRFVKMRAIPLVQPGQSSVTWTWYFAPFPRGVRESMFHPDPAHRVHWRVWVEFEDGTTTSIGERSFTSDSLWVPSGSPVSVGSVANGRDRNGKMTHALGMNPNP